MKLIKYLRLVIVLNLCGCATHPINTPSTAAVVGDIERAQTATSQADAKAEVILQYLKSEK